jgi:hypothetical protein
MPDDWETANGLNPNSAADAAQDTDLDGATNLAEYRAGTNPQSAPSALRITSFRSLGSTVQLKFLAVTGKSYELQSRPDLTTPGWTTISNIPAPAVTGEVTVNAPATGPAGFYRVVLSGAP